MNKPEITPPSNSNHFPDGTSMDVGTFRARLSGMDDLTAEQREEVQEILDGREPGEEVTSAIEDRVAAERCCPHCGTGIIARLPRNWPSSASMVRLA